MKLPCVTERVQSNYIGLGDKSSLNKGESHGKANGTLNGILWVFWPKDPAYLHSTDYGFRSIGADL